MARARVVSVKRNLKWADILASRVYLHIYRRPRLPRHVEAQLLRASTMNCASNQMHLKSAEYWACRIDKEKDYPELKMMRYHLLVILTHNKVPHHRLIKDTTTRSFMYDTCFILRPFDASATSQFRISQRF